MRFNAYVEQACVPRVVFLQRLQCLRAPSTSVDCHFECIRLVCSFYVCTSFGFEHRFWMFVFPTARLEFSSEPVHFSDDGRVVLRGFGVTTAGMRARVHAVFQTDNGSLQKCSLPGELNPGVQLFVFRRFERFFVAIFDR